MLESTLEHQLRQLYLGNFAKNFGSWRLCVGLLKIINLSATE